ncbi:protein NLRC3-like isoform X1, partial [Lates japonicus]
REEALKQKKELSLELANLCDELVMGSMASKAHAKPRKAPPSSPQEEEVTDTRESELIRLHHSDPYIPESIRLFLPDGETAFNECDRGFSAICQLIFMEGSLTRSAIASSSLHQPHARTTELLYLFSSTVPLIVHRHHGQQVRRTPSVQYTAAVLRAEGGGPGVRGGGFPFLCASPGFLVPLHYRVHVCVRHVRLG